MQSKQLGTFGIKHGGRCPHINDPAMKTRHVDVSSGSFSFQWSTSTASKHHVPFSSYFNPFSHGTFWEEFKKYFFVGGAPQDLWRECCPELKLICRGSISTHAFVPLMTLGRNIKVTILTDNNLVGWQCSRTTVQTGIHTFCNNEDCTILWPCNVVQQCISAILLYIWNRLMCDVNSFAISDDLIPCLRSPYWSIKEAAHGQVMDN